MGWMPHAEGLCRARRASASRHLLPVCRGALLGWVLPLANQQLTPDIVSWEELKAKEGCQEELPACAANAVPCLEAEEKQSSCHRPWVYVGYWHPLSLPSSLGTPQRNLLPSKTSAAEAGELGKRISLHLSSLWGKFVWTSTSRWEALSFPGPTVWDWDKGSPRSGAGLMCIKMLLPSAHPYRLNG